MKIPKKFPIAFAIVFLLYFSAFSALSAVSQRNTYHVSPDGTADGDGSESAPWDISTANASLLAGDTAILHGGDYEFNIHPVNSGEEGAPITYLAAKGEVPRFYRLRNGLDVEDTSYIIIDGIEVAETKFWIEAAGADHLTIRNSIFHNDKRPTSFSACYMEDMGDYLHIANSTFSKSGGDSLRIIGGNHHLIENNTFDTAGHSLLTLIAVQDSVIRNNYFSNPTQKNMEVFNSWDNDREPPERKSEYLLIEGNKFALAEAVAVDSMGWSGIQYAGSSSILRHNVFHDTGLGIDIALYDGSDQDAWSNTHNRFYNNTFYKNGYQSMVGGDSNGTGVGFLPYSSPKWTSDAFQAYYSYEDQIFSNNLFYLNQSMVPSSPRSAQIVFDHNAKPEYSRLYNNLLFYTKAEQPIIFFRDEWEWYTVTEFERAYPEFAEGNIQADPQMVDPENGDFTLQETSPAIDSGRDLTFATAPGTGNLIPVQDALYFSDGKGVVNPDIIRVNGQRATIIRVDYENNTLEISETLSWKTGDPVTLDYAGDAPDIGA
ncbi:MAG TPA: right-handed parallel beta-helix repeat-containing protein, partial [Anaerolineales bacterium]|nr:right-handed parallel beta-helix repeat-containing protein [Anaerolineales bacterium]